MRARSEAGVSPDRMATDGMPKRLAAPLGDRRDSGERRAEVALDVDGQRLQGRDVEHAATFAWPKAPA